MNNILYTLLFTLLVQNTAQGTTLSCSDNQKSATCLVCNCYHESRGEPYDGQVAVSKTVLSRAESKSSEFPDTICGNIYKKWQFSWTNDKKSNDIVVDNSELVSLYKNPNYVQDLIEKQRLFHKTKSEKYRLSNTEAYIICQDSSKVAMYEGGNGLLYFYNPDQATPKWARTHKNCGQVGHHIFMVPPQSKCPASLGRNSSKTSPVTTKKNSSIN